MDRRYAALDTSAALPSEWEADAGLTYTPGEDGATLAASGARGRIALRLLPRDTKPRQRADATLHVQATIQGLTSAPATWPATIGIGLSDGVRRLLLVIGPVLALVDDAGNTVQTITATGHAWERATHYRLTKEGQERWVVYVNGERAAEAPYKAAPLVAGSTPADTRARAYAGSLDPSGASSARFAGVVASANLRPAFPIEVDRWLSLLPRIVEVNDRWRALAKATAGMFADVSGLMAGLHRERTGGEVVLLDVRQRAGAAPAEHDPPWSVFGSTAVVRQRWLLTATSINTQDLSGLDYPDETQVVCKARWQVGEAGLSPGGSDELGPVVWIKAAGRAVIARMFQRAAGDGVYWSLMDGTTAGAGELGDRFYVQPETEHAVEVVLLPDRWGLLKVDGRVVSRVAWADLAATVVEDAVVRVDRGTWYVRGARVRVAAFDLSLRPDYLRFLASLLIPSSGCERNDELERWQVDRWEAMRHRGTLRGVEQELARITCGDGALVGESWDGVWHLDHTFPDYDPLIMDPPGGRVIHAWAEVPNPTGLSQADLARMLARYVLPVSAWEARYYVARAETMTAPSSVPATGTTRLTVADTTGFAVGDVVEIRAAADVTGELTEIKAIGSGTIDVAETPSTWTTGDVIRLVIART